ncbi:hypothetical protein A2335_04780 [Candidatus Peregrinibacteria bacterium RIFOXYB2_FULL_32_7]|nr:MAG: hypothetical protein A2335_04780 [Candidatus Peregrinibacteria bacterium RIFOXYB2_FULL_32_7]
MGVAISIRNLHKIYANGTKALNDVSFDIKEGEFFGLLGPNGSGKTTIINILSGATRLTTGEVDICGCNILKYPEKIKMLLGVVPQEVTFDSFFDVNEILNLQSGYYGIRNNQKKIDELLERLSLKDKKYTNNRTLSGGMKRRLLIAKALVHNPKIFILDEPTAGVDVELRYGLWEYIKELNKNGLTILLTTHYLEEAENLCRKIAIINKGDLIALEKTKKLLKSMGDNKKMTLIFKEIVKSIPKEILPFNPQLKNDFEIIINFEVNNLMTVFENLRPLSTSLADINLEGQSLEKIFINLTKK